MTDATIVDPYEAVIADLEQRIASMQATLENLKGIRGVTGTIAPSSPAAPRAATITVFTHDAFFGMTVGDAARKYLTAIKKTASVPMIVEALVSGGWKTASKNAGDTIRAILSRNDEFVKINGEFGLTEWYPGRKSGPKPRPLTAQQETAEDVVSAPGADVEPS